MEEHIQQAIISFSLALIIIAIFAYKFIIYPAMPTYFDQKLYMRDITRTLSLLTGITLITISIRKAVQQHKEIKEHERWQQREALENARKEQEQKEQQKKKELEHKYWEEQRRQKEQEEKEKQRQQELERQYHKEQVRELTQFKRKYGYRTQPLNKTYPQNVIRDAKIIIKKEIERAKRIEEAKNKATTFYQAHSKNTRPDHWQKLEPEEKHAWEQTRKQQKNTPQTQDNRLQKIIKNL